MIIAELSVNNLPLKQERELALVTGDGGRGCEATAGLGLADVEQAHHAQQHHGGGVQLQHGHLLDQRLVPVLVAGVAAPRADEDVRVGHLHVEVLGHAATVHRLLVEVLVGAQQTHLRLQIRVLNIEQQVSSVPTQENAPLTSLSQREILMLMMDTVLLTSSFCMSSGGSSTKSCNMGTYGEKKIK